MGRNLKKIFFLIVIAASFYGCSREEQEIQEEVRNDNVREFIFRQFAENTSFVLAGESAEISDTSQTSVEKPSLSLKTASERIIITTGKDGKGRFEFLPESREIDRIVFTGEVKIVYKDLSTGKTTMEGACEKLTYSERDGTIIMEGSPVLISEDNRFSGEIIFYNFTENTLQIEGNVNVQITAD